MAKHHGQLELTWADKDKALLSVGDGKYDYTFVEPHDYRVSEVRLLHEADRFEAPVPENRTEELPEPTTGNLLITGDAMHVLDALRCLPEYADKYLGKVKLCYIDPPFNTGKVFDNYEDNIEHSIWLTMLRDRLQQIKPLLSPDGCVWVHLDDTEVHRCRVVLDEVMGSDNFVAEVVWQKADSTRNDSKGISEDHDTLLVYRASPQWKPKRLPRTAEADARFSSPDGDPLPWFDDNPSAPGAQTHQGMVYAVQHPLTGELIYPARGRHWWTEQRQVLAYMQEYAPYELRNIEDAAQRADLCGIAETNVRQDVRAVMLTVPLDDAKKAATGRLESGNWPVVVLRSRGGLGRKSYIPEGGMAPRTWWSNDEVGHNREAKAEIKALFPGLAVFATPKPERLIRRIVQISSDPGDIVLDCFVGSGTTAAVAHKLGRHWVASELLSGTIDTYARPRLLKVLRGEDLGGVTSETLRVAATEEGLPDGMTPDEAQQFNRLLRKALKAIDGSDEKDVVKALRDATKTRDQTTVGWYGGGGFVHLRVGESMFEEVGGLVLLADWATNGPLTEAMCAQLGIRHQPDGIFAGKRGRVRFVILDGMVTSSTVSAILDQLPADEIVEVWATQIDPVAAEELRKARLGSKLLSIPASVLDSYRRRAARRSPFKPAANNGEKP